jgi:hydroxylysine kinase
MPTQLAFAPNDTMLTADAAVAPSDVARLVRAHYGLECRATALRSERDEIFSITAMDDTRYVLRISNGAEDGEAVDLQSRALLHLERFAPEIPVPRLLATQGGACSLNISFADDRPRIVRLFSYLEGQALAGTGRTSSQLNGVGTALAQLDVALSDFSHPAASRHLAWDLAHADRLLTLTNTADRGRPWRLAYSFLRDFRDRVSPAMGRLRRQVIHNDLNPHNLLVDPAESDRITGIIDFGDIVAGPLINDLAIAASYYVDGADPLSALEEVVGAYNRVVVLQREEVDLLFDLIGARLAMAVAITEWRARRYPDNSAYILKNTVVAWRGLESLSAIDGVAASRRLRAACGME